MKDKEREAFETYPLGIMKDKEARAFGCFSSGYCRGQGAHSLVGLSSDHMEDKELRVSSAYRPARKSFFTQSFFHAAT